MVKVYRFTGFDISSGRNRLSPRLARGSVIRRLKGEIVGPAVEVETALLDGNGMISVEELPRQ